MNDIPLHIPKMSENKINKYFNLAREVSKFSDMHKFHLGSVLIYKNKVISVGWNMESKTSPIQKEFNKFRNYDINASRATNSFHAEIHCLHKARNLEIEWNKASLFTYRLKKTGERGMARSCPACMAYAKSLGLRHIYYTTNTGWAYERLES